MLKNDARGTGGDDMALCMQGDVVARRARYEAKWASFVASTQPGITHAQVPWLGDNAADIQVDTHIPHHVQTTAVREQLCNSCGSDPTVSSGH